VGQKRYARYKKSLTKDCGGHKPRGGQEKSWDISIVCRPIARPEESTKRAHTGGWLGGGGEIRHIRACYRMGMTSAAQVLPCRPRIGRLKRIIAKEIQPRCG